ncbi:MAG: hypothetical protein LBD70_08145 [Bifidobacteriaceae bacterium]|nr:hypothetical protein [Bifidobacteriaceae bacterium]
MKLSPKNRAGRTVALVAAGMLLTGCGGAEEPSDAQSQPEPQASPSAPESAGAAASPGVSGVIAAVTDALLQVQDSEKQTAVAYSADTVITAQVAGAAADVAVGLCVTAIGQAATPDDEGAAGDEGAGQEVFAAATVAVSQPESDGACAAGFGGARGGSFGSGELPEGGMPEGGMPGGELSEGETPPGMPSGRGSAGPGFAGETGDGAGQMPGGAMAANMASGLVTAVDGETVTVEQSGAAFPGGAASSDAASGDGQTEVLTRSFTIAEAAITVTKAVDATALQVGKCVVARGETDSSGRVAAQSLAVSDPGEDGCDSAGGRSAGGWGGAAPGGAAPGGEGDNGGTATADTAESLPNRPGGLWGPGGGGGASPPDGWTAPDGETWPDGRLAEMADEGGELI